MDPMQQLQENQKAAIAIIENAKSDIEQVLKGQESVRIGVVAHLSRGANFLHGLTGTAPDNSSQHTFGPMTSFMGEPIERPEPVAAADLKPTDVDKEQFRTKRNHLLGALPDMSDDAAFAYLNQPQGEALLRNVARIASVPNYDSAEINVNFLADVRKGLAWLKSEAEAEQVARDAKAEAADLRSEGENEADISADTAPTPPPALPPVPTVEFDAAANQETKTGSAAETVQVETPTDAKAVKPGKPNKA